MTRATDADSYNPSDPDALGQGDAFFVTEGDTGAGELYVCTTVGTITFGTTDINFTQISSAQIYSAGTGLTLTGTTFSITNTAVSAATYGSASQVPVFDVNAQGQITGVTDTPIAISGAAVSGDIAGNAGSATNIAGGGAGQVPYNTGAGATSFVAAGSSGQLLQSNGTSAPSWVTPSYAAKAYAVGMSLIF